jgi:iron complex outermembrane receptor protein
MFMLPVPNHRETTSGLSEEQDTVTDAQSLNLTYRINETLNLTSISSRKKTVLDSMVDYDFSPAHIMHTFHDGTYHQLYSQELRLDSSSGRLNWLAGLYYEDNEYVQNLSMTSAMMPGHVYDNELTGESYALFGQAGYFITEQLRIIGGLRYENQDMNLTGPGVSAGTLSDSWDKVSPKLALEYNLAPEIMTYANVSQGYRSGGFNHLAADPQYYSYGAETIWSYEVGLKSLFLDKRLMINGSIFYMDINDMQVEEAVDPMISWITNAAKATSQGIELEIAAKVTDNLSLMGGLGYTDCEYDTFSDTNGNYEGNQNPFAPEYTFNLGAQYRNDNGFYARADLIGYGEMFLDKANQYSRDAYQIVNAKIGYEAETFDIYLYGKNIFDEVYDAEGYYGGAYVIYSDPGEYGLQLTYRF